MLARGTMAMTCSCVKPRLACPVCCRKAVKATGRRLRGAVSRVGRTRPSIYTMVSMGGNLMARTDTTVPIIPLCFTVLCGMVGGTKGRRGYVRRVTELFARGLCAPANFRASRGNFVHVSSCRLAPRVRRRMGGY